MFTKIIQSVLMKHVGKYLNEVEENSFDVGLIDGDILIQNVGLNNKLFEELNLPIILKFSNIDRLSIKVPWTRLEKEPSIVHLSGLNVLITMEEQSTNSESTGLAYKFNRVIAWIKEELKRDKQGQKKEKEINLEDDSFATKMLLRIVDNIVVEITNIHVRFQDYKCFPGQSFSLGLLIDRISLQTTDQDGNNLFYHRSFSRKKRNQRLIKSVLVSPVRVYWNPTEEWFISDAIDNGASKGEIIRLMRYPFPGLRDQPMSPTSGSKKSTTNLAQPVQQSSTDLDLTQKKEKKQKPNAFLELFKPRETKKKEEKPKESPSKTQQKPKQQPEPIKPKKQLKPLADWRLEFQTVAEIALSATVEMNDLRDKDTPLLEIEINIDSLKVSSNQAVVGQLFCLLQHFLKYATDIYFFENRSSINNSNLESSNKEKFHAAITAILKKNSKIKRYQQLTLDHFGNEQLKEMFSRVLDGYSIRRLEEFAESFMFEWRMKKEIERAREGHAKSKEKSVKDMQKIIDKMRSGQQEEKDEELIINTTRAIFELKLQLEEAAIVVDYIEQGKRIDSLSLSLKGFFCQLRFVTEEQLDLMVKLHDIVISYTNRSGRVILLNKNVLSKEETLVSLLYSQKKKVFSLTGELQRKILIISDQTVGFVLHFFQRLRINVFMLNLMVEKAQFSIDKLNILIKLLLDSLKDIKVDLKIYLPILELNIPPFHLIAEPGVITLNMPGSDFIELGLHSLFLRMFHHQMEYKLVDNVAVRATLKRHNLQPPKYEDIIDIAVDRLCLNAPPIAVVDLLAMEVLKFAGNVVNSTFNLVVRRKQLLATGVHYNNHLEEFDLHLHGQMLEFSNPNTGHQYSTTIFRTRVYPLVHNHRHYLVLVRKGEIEYIECKDPKQLTADRLNGLIEKLATCQQLTIFWDQINKYEQAVEVNALAHSHTNLLTFIETTQKQARSRTFKLYQVRLTLASMHFEMPHLALNVKRLQLQSIHHEHNQQLKLTMARFSIAVGGASVVEMAPSAHIDDFMQLSYEKVVSEHCDARIGTIDINLTAGLFAPVLTLIADVMAMRIIKAERQQRKLLPPAHFSSHRLFSLRQVEFKAKIDRLTFEFFTAVSTIEQILMEATQETTHSSLQMSVREIDVLDFLRVPACSLKVTVSEVEGSNVTIAVESLILQVNPTLFDKYLSIMRQAADGVLLNLHLLHQIQKGILESIEFQKLVQRINHHQLSLKLQSVQIQVVLNQQHALALCCDQAILDISQYQRSGQPRTNISLAVMRLHLQRIHQSLSNDQLQSTVIRPFSITAKAEIAPKELMGAQLAITKIDIELNFELLEFLVLILQRYIVIYGKNPWFAGFLRRFIEQQQFILTADRPKSMKDFNSQLDEITLVYLREGGAPFLKCSLKSTRQAIELTELHLDGKVGLELQISHFNWKYKIFEPLLERSEAELIIRKYLGKGVNSIQAVLKAVRVNVSKDVLLDIMHLAQRMQQYYQLHRSRFLEVAFYYEQITAKSNKQHKQLLDQAASPETKKHRNLVENFRSNHLIITDSVPRKRHTKNYIKLCNRLGVDVVCVIDYLYNEEPARPFPIITGQDYLMPMSVDCQYVENYQVLERLKKLRLQLRVGTLLLFSKNFNLATFMAQSVEIPAGGQLKLPINLSVTSNIVDDQYTIQFTTAKRVENRTQLQFELAFRSEHSPDYKTLLPRCSTVFMPYFTTNSFCISIVGSKQLFLLNFSKSELPQEIKLPGANGETHNLIMHSEVKDGLFTMMLDVGLEIFNHLPLYVQLEVNNGKILLEPGKCIRTTLISLHEGHQQIEVQIPNQTVPGKIEVDSPDKLRKEHQLTCRLLHSETEITLYLLLVGQPASKLLYLYPRLSFINQTPQKLFVFCSAYGALFPVQKMLRDNAQDYQKISFHQTVQPAVRCRIKPLRNCYVLDSERYLHIGLRNCRKGLSEQFVTYESDFRKTVTAEQDNLIHKFCVRYEETPLTQEISTFKARLLPKFYLINRTEYVVYLLQDSKVAPNEMVVLPFTKDGLLMLDLEGKEGRLHQLAPAELFERGQIRYQPKNLGFMSSHQMKEGQIDYDESMIVKLQLELIFNNFLGYYILNRRTEKLLVRNHLKKYTVLLQDGTSENFKVLYEILSGQQKQLFPVFSQQFHLSLVTRNTAEPYFNQPVDLQTITSIEHADFEVREYFSNNLRVITFGDCQQESSDAEPDQQSIRSIAKLSIESLAVSLVMEDFGERRKQILNLQLEKLALTVLDYQHISITEARIQDLMVRSNETHAYPILLKKLVQQESTPFLSVFMQASPTNRLIENFRMQLAPLSVNLNDQIIELLIRNQQSLMNSLSTVTIELMAIPQHSGSFDEFYRLYQKKKQKLLEKGNHHQIKLVNFSIAVIEIELSLKQVHFQGNRKYLKSFGLSLVDIDRARLCLSELKMMDTQQSQEQFVGAIVGSYYNQSLSLAFSALGGMNIIGNPKEFFMEIKTGVGQYNTGIVRGTGGLLRGVTAGAANAVSKIMGSLGNGIGSLSLDDKYLNERETIKQRQINGFVDGLSSSGLSIYKGIECGITGLVRQPYQGMKEDGFFGALKGSLKGLAGLITKPLTGIIDATSKTAQGLTVASSLNRQNRSAEQWYKPLYFLRSIVRPYDDVDQMCCLFLRKFLPDELGRIQLVKCFLLQSEDPATFVDILVIGLRELLQINIKQRTVQLRIDTGWLRATAKFSQGVVLYYQCDKDEEQLILRLKRSNELKNLLYFTLQKLIETSKQVD